MKKLVFYVTTLFITQNVWSAEKTVVLQNGLNNYKGCIDSYIFTDPALDEESEDPKNTNECEDSLLNAKNCPG